MKKKEDIIYITRGGRGRGGCHKNAYKYNPYFSIKGCNQLALFMQKILYQVCLQSMPCDLIEMY